MKIESWNHLFHDAGGLWTWELFKEVPEKVDNLMILNTIIYEDGFNPPIRFKKGFIARYIMAIYSNGISTNMMLKGLFKTGLLDNKLMSKTDIEGYKRPILEGKIKAMYHFFSNTCNDLPDYSKVIENLNMPKLLIWGKHDEFLMLEKKKVVSNFNLKDENTHLIEAKHFIQEEQPQIINKLILSFLKN